MASKLDPQLAKDKDVVMRETRVNSLFYGMSDTFKFVAGIMLAAGMALVTAELKTASPSSFSAAMGALAANPVGLAFLGVAGVVMAAAVGSQYISSRYYHAGAYDSLETNARHTAKYLVQEIKKENMCMTDEQEKGRSDGKSWVQATVVERREFPTPGQSIH